MSLGEIFGIFFVFFFNLVQNSGIIVFLQLLEGDSAIFSFDIVAIFRMAIHLLRFPVDIDLNFLGCERKGGRVHFI